MFIGSRLGDSVLLQFSKVGTAADDVPVNETAISVSIDGGSGGGGGKRRRLSSAAPDAAAEVFDDYAIYGDDDHQLSTVAAFEFAVCDSLLNVGPIRNTVFGYLEGVGGEALDSAGYGGKPIELVSCAGYGKTGALSVLQQDVRPSTVFRTNALDSYTDLWAVQSVGAGAAAAAAATTGAAAAAAGGKGSDGDGDAAATEAPDAAAEDSTHDQYVFLSKEDKTMVLACSEGGFKPVDEEGTEGFHSEGETIFVGNMGGGRFILQVYAGGARLLRGTAQVQHVRENVRRSTYLPAYA